MNGVHDMGGMQDMGPIKHELDEPPFHEPWEGRVYALNRSAAATGKWTLDATRYEIELIPPADYLRMSYYERWYTRLIELLVKRQMVTRAEVESGLAAKDSAKVTPALTLATLPPVLSAANPARPDANAAARFAVGQKVRTRNINPVHHTRLPRYARGKQGFVMRDHGIFVFPDTNAHFAGETPQHLYSVRFAARELWGNDASARDTVHLDLWDDYLEDA